jgi:porin
MQCKLPLCLMAIMMLSCATTYSDVPTRSRDDLTGDWDGLRTHLLDEGIDFRIGYTSETASNLQGGYEELWRYADQWTFATTLDLQKLIGLDQAQFKIVVTDRNGRNLSADANLHTVEPVQEIYGRGQTWRWTQVWYDQSYFNGMLDWKFGRLTEDGDFAAFGCEFQNLTFCDSPPGNLAGSHWYNAPVSEWGTRLKLSAIELGYVQIGVFEVNPSYLLTKYALDLGDPPGATGALLPLEVGWLPTFGKGLKGSYKFGAWYNTSKAPDVVENTNGQPLALAGGQPVMHRGQDGAYVNFLQQLTNPSSPVSQQGLNVFLNATLADRRTSILDNQIAAGLLYKGPLASRPADELGFSLGRTHVNSRVADVEILQNAVGLGPTGVQRSEYAGELFYNVHAAPWLDLRPNIQYVRQPGGVAQNTDDVILGLRLSINF